MSADLDARLGAWMHDVPVAADSIQMLATVPLPARRVSPRPMTIVGGVAAAVIVAVVGLLVVGGTKPPSPSTPPIISMAVAEQLALDAAGGTAPPPSVASVALSSYGAQAAIGKGDAFDPVWAIVVDGSFPSGSCGGITASPHPCPSPATSALVLIDAHTGVVIEIRTPAPDLPATSTEAVPGPSDVPVTPPPYVSGSCPTTPFSYLRRGTLPIVRTSGIDWNWGGLPWSALVGQKVVLPETLQGTVIAAERLPIGPSSSTMSVRYPEANGPGFVFGVGLPAPGCWLLTEVGSASTSVVVNVGPAPKDPPSPQQENVPIRTATQQTTGACPTSPTDPTADVRTWLDGVNRWADPMNTLPWRADERRKLVVSGAVGEVAPYELITAERIGALSGYAVPPAFVPDAPVFATPAPGSGSKAFEVTLPTAGCWAFTYIDPIQTSTIVVAIEP